MKRTRVVLVDDHLILMEAIKKLLEQEYDVVGMFSDGASLLETVASLQPDVAVVDVQMPTMNGLSLCCHLKKLLPKMKVILLTVDRHLESVGEAFRSGASGYVLKTSAASELMTAIREVVRGGYFATASLTDGMIGSFVQNFKKKKASHNLTHRQKEVLKLLAEGYSMKQVAGVLHIAPRTVAFHKYAMMEQLEVSSSAELISYAIKSGVAAS
jgi:DNA-binding NarL/FixJ family response regulator